MKRNLLALLLFAKLVEAQTPPVAPEKTLVLTHIAVIDATGSPAKPDMSVVIRDHKIVMIGETGKLPVFDDAEVVEGTGKFLIPGLWDMHVHTGPREIYLPLYIANGITGVRDMGGDLEEPTGELSTRYVQLRLWREEIEKGFLLGLRIVIA